MFWKRKCVAKPSQTSEHLAHHMIARNPNLCKQNKQQPPKNIMCKWLKSRTHNRCAKKNNPLIKKKWGINRRNWRHWEKHTDIPSDPQQTDQSLNVAHAMPSCNTLDTYTFSTMMNASTAPKPTHLSQSAKEFDLKQQVLQTTTAKCFCLHILFNKINGTKLKSYIYFSLFRHRCL